MHNIEIVVTTDKGMDFINFDDLDDTQKIFSTFRSVYYSLENDNADYSLSLINTDDNVRLCKASKCDNVIMYAYNKALLPVNILATIPQ